MGPHQGKQDGTDGDYDRGRDVPFQVARCRGSEQDTGDKQKRNPEGGGVLHVHTGIPSPDLLHYSYNALEEFAIRFGR